MLDSLFLEIRVLSSEYEPSSALIGSVGAVREPPLRSLGTACRAPTVITHAKLIPPTQADTLNLDMSYTYAPQSFDSLESSWNDLRHQLGWDSVFVLPRWLKVWWQAFGEGSKLYLFDVKENKNIIGIAPLMVKEGKASFIGSADVCDYMDFMVAPGKELRVLHRRPG